MGTSVCGKLEHARCVTYSLELRLLDLNRHV